MISLANVFPQECVELYSSFKEGRMDEAEELNRKLVELNQQVSGTYTVAGVKVAMEMVGYVGGDPRRPLRALTAEQQTGIRKAMERSGFLREGRGGNH